VKVAVVGGGVSGLVCAWLLRRRHEVVLFEANEWVGGHTHTLPVEAGGRVYPVDTGFIVYNERTYPNFTRLLARLGVATRPTQMSFSVHCERTGLEYASSGLAALFAQPGNLLSLSFHRMLRDVPRFYRDARALLAAPDEKATLGAWLDGRGFSHGLADHFLLPMCAAIWSAEPESMREFPAFVLFRFLENHGLLGLRDQPVWRSVEGGSWQYVERLTADMRTCIRARARVRSVRRLSRVAEVGLEGGRVEAFDQVVIAAHADEALALLADPSEAERRILGAIRFQENDVVLHTDASLLPRRRAAWASWNYRIPREKGARPSVTYHMNRLQGLAAPVDFCVTLNGGGEVDPARVIAEMTYRHPVFDLAASEAQRRHGAISGVNRTHYCGAYWGYGFHEDGVVSALRVARALGAELPEW
jgi:predicted NAD/FAD-binding protein